MALGPRPRQGLACCGPSPGTAGGLSLWGREDWPPVLESGRLCEPGQACHLLAVAMSGRLPPAGLWLSRCSYLWIVPISSIRNGTQQEEYWLQGEAKSKPAPP